MSGPESASKPSLLTGARLLTAIDLAGVYLFAVEGANAGTARHLDLLGLAIVAFVTGLGGGIVRDVLLGAIPPPGIHEWRYGFAALLGAASVIVAHQGVTSIPAPLIVTLDAAALGLFAVAGAGKALDYGVSPTMSVAMGALTGCGGGVVRDVLLAKIPQVMASDIYAVAAILGACIVVAGRLAQWPANRCALAGALACFLLRMTAWHFAWQLPVVR